MKVITLTLNPAIDVHCECNDFALKKESIAKIISRDMGGKGVNLSRALLSCGKKHKSLVVTGAENGDEFKRELDKDGLDLIEVSIDGRIRENITIHQAEVGETRLSFEGFTAPSDLLEKVLDAIPSDLSDYILTFTGSTPKGASKESVMDFLKKLKGRGAKLVLDSRSLTIEDIIAVSPWLIKPNEDESKTYSGLEMTDFKQAKQVAKKFHDSGVENALISLGGRGAVLVNNDGEFEAVAPKIEVLSTIGAGDSMIAGFISAELDGMTSADKLNFAISCGSSACMERGTKAPKIENITKLFKEMK